MRSVELLDVVMFHFTKPGHTSSFRFLLKSLNRALDEHCLPRTLLVYCGQPTLCPGCTVLAELPRKAYGG